MPRTRRDFLGAVGVAALSGLAGCTDLTSRLDVGGDDTPTIDGDALRAVADIGSPAVHPEIPAPVSPSFLDEGERRARELLSSVPETVTASAIPNEAVRNVVEEARADAERSLNRVAVAESPAERLRSLRYARGNAAMVSATYRAATGDLTEADVRAEVPALRDDIAAFRDSHTYRGAAVGPAIVAHDAVDRFAATASRYLDNADDQGRYARGAPRVGEVAEAVESSRASIESARHVADRFEASLRSPRDLGGAFREAASTLVAAVESRVDEYPGGYRDIEDGFDRDVSDEPAHTLVMETYLWMEAAGREARGHLRAGRLAQSLRSVHDAEARRRALDAATAAIEGGAHADVESATEVREAKLGALEAIETARSDAAHPALSRAAAASLTSRVGRGDASLTRRAGGDASRAATDAAGQYAFVDYVGTEIPGASSWLVGTVAAVLGGSDER